MRRKTSKAIDRLVDKATKRSGMAGFRNDVSKRILVAGRILEIYGNGGGYKDVMQEFGAVPVDKKTGRAMNKDRLLAWAAEAFMNDEAEQIGAARITKELEDVLKGRVTDVAEWDNDGITLKASSELSRAQLAGVAAVETTESGVKVKMVDRLKAASLLKDIYIGNTVKVEGEVQHTHRLAERLDQAIRQVAAPTIDVTPDEPKS